MSPFKLSSCSTVNLQAGSVAPVTLATSQEKASSPGHPSCEKTLFWCGKVGKATSSALVEAAPSVGGSVGVVVEVRLALTLAMPDDEGDGRETNEPRLVVVVRRMLNAATWKANNTRRGRYARTEPKQPESPLLYGLKTNDKAQRLYLLVVLTVCSALPHTANQLVSVS